MTTKIAPTIWLTGLPSSGKTTIANEIHRKLSLLGYNSEILDGDIIRKNLWQNLGFTKKDRITNLKRVIYLAELFTRNNIIVIVAFVSPYRSIRNYARKQLAKFTEVYIKCPLEICKNRDVKGLYQKAIRGEIKDFTGISHPYEVPTHPELTVDTQNYSVSKCTKMIMDYLKVKYDY